MVEDTNTTTPESQLSAFSPNIVIDSVMQSFRQYCPCICLAHVTTNIVILEISIVNHEFQIEAEAFRNQKCSNLIFGFLAKIPRVSGGWDDFRMMIRIFPLSFWRLSCLFSLSWLVRTLSLFLFCNGAHCKYENFANFHKPSSPPNSQLMTQLTAAEQNETDNVLPQPSPICRKLGNIHV